MSPSTAKAGRAKAGSADLARKLEQLMRNPSKEDVEFFRRMLEDVEQRLPRATSGEVLSSRVKW